MRWLKRRTERTDGGSIEAARALGRAEERLEKIQNETPEIMRTAAVLKRLGEQNDFALKIREALGG